MTRFAAIALLSFLIATPAVAQVINGETPLDETKIHSETSRPVGADRSPPPPAAASTPAAPQDAPPSPSPPRD